MLLALVSMILDGTNIEYQTNTTQAALTIAQLLKFNAVCHQRKAKTVSVWHSLAHKTPVPIYVGLQVHAHTHERELIDNLSHLGMSISYDCILRLSTEMGNAVCKMYELENIVCLPMICLIITLMCHQCLLESKAHQYLLELQLVSNETITNPTKKRKQMVEEYIQNITWPRNRSTKKYFLGCLSCKPLSEEGLIC